MLMRKTKNHRANILLRVHAQLTWSITDELELELEIIFNDLFFLENPKFQISRTSSPHFAGGNIFSILSLRVGSHGCATTSSLVSHWAKNHFLTRCGHPPLLSTHLLLCLILHSLHRAIIRPYKSRPHICKGKSYRKMFAKSPSEDILFRFI